MTRRDTFKAAAAGLVLPWWLGGTAKGVGRVPAREDVTIRAALLRFVDTEVNPRYDFTKIYLQGSQLHASDGCIGARAEAVQDVGDGGQHNAPPFLDMWERFTPDQRGWRWLPPLNMTKEDTNNNWCGLCEVKCPADCEEGFQYEWGDGEPVKYARCKTCDGEGWVYDPNCTVCHGKPADVSGVEQFGAGRFAAHYTERIRQAAAMVGEPVEFATHQVHGPYWSKGHVDVLQFAAGPLRGALCGLVRCA